MVKIHCFGSSRMEFSLTGTRRTDNQRKRGRDGEGGQIFLSKVRKYLAASSELQRKIDAVMSLESLAQMDGSPTFMAWLGKNLPIHRPKIRSVLL
jgi:hypothetical protein